jgi:hypothetical protein
MHSHLSIPPLVPSSLFSLASFRRKGVYSRMPNCLLAYGRLTAALGDITSDSLPASVMTANPNLLGSGFFISLFSKPELANS